VNATRRDSWLVAAGVVAALIALVVVGRLQAGNLPIGDAGVSQPTRSTVSVDATPVASGLAVAGRVVLPGRQPRSRSVRMPSGCCWSRAPCCGSTPSATG
jgi:hypothetical protein